MPTLRKGTLKRIHVNGALLRKKLKASKPLSIKTRGKTMRASSIYIDGPSWLVYQPKHPLSSGAVLWVETDEEVTYT